MKEKKSFVLYCDLIHTIEKMPDDKAGELFKHILKYVNDEDPQTDDLIINLTFEPIKQQLKRDLIKWGSIKVYRSESGRLGGIKSGEARREKKQNEANEASAIILKQTKANEAVNVNVNVNDNVNVNKIEERKLKFSNSLKPFLEVYGKELLNSFYKYWTEPNKSNTKFRMELEKTWSTERRLETWSSREKSFIKDPTKNIAVSTNNLEGKKYIGNKF